MTTGLVAILFAVAAVSARVVLDIRRKRREARAEWKAATREVVRVRVRVRARRRQEGKQRQRRWPDLYRGTGLDGDARDDGQ